MANVGARVANASTRELWESYTGHRVRVTDVLASASSRTPRPPNILLVGAGNCNDVELHALLDLCATITLLDIDGAAMADGLRRQELAGHPRLRTIEDDIDRVELGQEFDVVASMCMLSQYLDRPSTNDDDPAHLASSVAARRRGYLQRLASWARPSTTSLLIVITDIVSSDTVQLPTGAATNELLALAREFVGGGNFFTGCNPGAIIETLDDWRCHDLRSWIWDMQARKYLVVSIAFDSPNS